MLLQAVDYQSLMIPRLGGVSPRNSLKLSKIMAKIILIAIGATLFGGCAPQLSQDDIIKNYIMDKVRER